jgi:hypothetical protein
MRCCSRPAPRSSRAAVSAGQRPPDRQLAPHSRTAVRNGNDCRQQRAEVLVITDGQPFDGAVLASGHEEHVEQAKNSPAAETIDLGQDPVLRTGVAAEAQSDHLQRCGWAASLAGSRRRGPTTWWSVFSLLPWALLCCAVTVTRYSAASDITRAGGH